MDYWNIKLDKYICKFSRNIFVIQTNTFFCTMIKYFRKLYDYEERGMRFGPPEQKIGQICLAIVDKYICPFGQIHFVYDDEIFQATGQKSAGVKFGPLEEILLCFVQASAPQQAPTKFLRRKFSSRFNQVHAVVYIYEIGCTNVILICPIFQQQKILSLWPQLSS